MKTHTATRQPTTAGRPRWPEPLGRPPAPVLPPLACTRGLEAPRHDFLIVNPRPDLEAPLPPPRDLTFYSVDFP